MAAQLLVETDGAALRLTLSNPGLRNALAPEMYDGLQAALERASADQACRAVIITGADGAFCAGGNLHRLRENRAKDKSVQAESIDRLHAFTRTLMRFEKPVIAAVEGAAAGAGCSLALACDLIVGAQSARFVMSYVKVGLSPDGGGSWFAARALSRQSAAEMLLLGDAWTSMRLHALGVVNRVTPDGASLEGARELVARIAALSPNAVMAAKRLSWQAREERLDSHLDAEKASFVDCLHHDDAGEAISAFLEKRAARFPPNP
jgi:enoyl-CoA hydratase/carnithine racemase